MNSQLRAECENCFGLCCVALPYAKSADFAFDKDGGIPCRNLQTDYRCGIHKNLRGKGFKGCTVYECFGAGQKVSQITYGGEDWRDSPERAKEMFEVFPIMQQLHEMLNYLYEALQIKETTPIYNELKASIQNIEHLTQLPATEIKHIKVSDHRAKVNKLLLQVSKLVRTHFLKKKYDVLKGKSMDMIGAKLRKADLRGANLRGVLLIAADLQGADMRWTDLIGADLRDANLSGADLSGSIFLTQAQVNSAKGNLHTNLPNSLLKPDHWLKVSIKNGL